jgi:hypothetical protein
VISTSKLNSIVGKMLKPVLCSSPLDIKKIFPVIQNGAVNHGLKYRPSCLIEAYFRPEKYWLVCVGLSANQLLNSNFICLSGGILTAAE